MNQTPKRKPRRSALNMPKRIIERVGDEVYGPGDEFPYVIKDAGKHLAELFGKELIRRLVMRRNGDQHK
jgi:hypothetical protein